MNENFDDFWKTKKEFNKALHDVIMFITNGDSLNHENESIKKLVSLCNRINFIPYSAITILIFKNSDSSIDYGSKLFENIKNNNYNFEEKGRKNITRIIEHMELSNVQRNNFYLIQQKDIDEQREELEEQQKSIQKSINDQKESIEKKSEEVRNSLHSEVISILGIFTAITFATFGGLDLISTLFKNISTINLRDAGSSIILGSSYLFCLYIIILALFISISKLLGIGDKYDLNKKTICRFLFGIFFLFFVGLILSFNNIYITCTCFAVILFCLGYYSWFK